MKDLDKLTASIIDRLKSEGAEMAHCSAACGETREFNIDGGEFSLFRTLFDNSLSLTAVIGGRKGSVSLNSFEDSAVDRAIADCVAAANSSEPDDGWGLCPDANCDRFVKGAVEPDLDRLFFRVKELKETVEKDYPLIVMEQMIVSHDNVHSVYRNTSGAHFTKDAGYYSVSLMFSAHEGELSSSFLGSGAVTDNLDKPFIELSSIRRDLEDVQKQIHTEPAEGKFVGTMVLCPGTLAEFTDSIVENFASDGTILDGTAIWRDKLGETVADPRLTVSFKPKDERIVCAPSYSGEGFYIDDFDFIRDGRLESFVLSLYVANKTGKKRSPNSGSGLIIKPGEKSLDEIISGIDRGILVGRFSGGAPSSNGDFSGVAKNSFLIENGKVTKAVAETMISGNLAEMLQNLRDISKETVSDGYTVLPYAAFDGITVSGK